MTRNQENGCLAELAAKKANQDAIQAQLDVVRNMIGVDSSYLFNSLYFCILELYIILFIMFYWIYRKKNENLQKIKGTWCNSN